MSNETKTDAGDSTNPGSGDKKAAKLLALINKKQLAIALAVLVFIALMSGGTLYLLNSLNEEDPELALLEAESTEENKATNEHDGKDANKDDKKPGEHSAAQAVGIYINLTPAFVVNFNGAGGSNFLQLDVTLLTHDPEVDAALKLHMPLVRNALVMLYSSQSIATLETAEGKESLRQQSLAEVKGILKKEIGREGVEDIFFTSFIMQ